MSKLLPNVERFPLKVGFTLDHKLNDERTKSPSCNHYLKKEPFS